MKKRFFRFSFSFFLFLLVILAPSFLMIIYFIIGGFNQSSWKSYVIALGVLGFIIYAIGHIKFRITFDKEFVKITGDVMPKDEKIQYPCSVKYDKITSVDLIVSSYNSKNMPIKLAWISSSIPKSYIEIKTEKRTYRFFVTYYSKRQKIKIVDEIIKRCEMIGNHLNVEDSKTIYANYLKKKKAVFHNFSDENNICGEDKKK